MTLELYYTRFFPRYDLYSQEPIRFKTCEQYFETDFLSRENLANWFKSQPLEKQKEFVTKNLLKFKGKRGDLAPNQVELRSLICPSVITCEKVWEKPFHVFCQDLFMTKRYEYGIKLDKFDKNILMKLFIDTREQQPLEFENVITIKSKLDIGDYCGAEEFFSRVFIDRKSGSDFISTFSDIERFEKELQRAKDLDNYIVVLVEEPFEKMLHFDKFFEHGKVALVWHNVRSLSRKFDNLQFLFVKDRKVAAQMVKNVVFLGQKVKTLDLQYCYDLGNL